MEEKLNQIEELLKEIVKKFEYHLRIKRTTLEHFDNELKQLTKDYLEVHPDKSDTYKPIFDSLLQDFKEGKEDNSFLEKDIPQLQSFLRNTLTSLEESLYPMEEGDLVPNEEFKRLISTGIINTSTLISSKFKGRTFFGYLTAEGFFELGIGDKRISFSSFRTAAERAWDKKLPNDCWNVWTATHKNGGNYSMKHYRQLLREK